MRIYFPPIGGVRADFLRGEAELEIARRLEWRQAAVPLKQSSNYRICLAQNGSGWVCASHDRPRGERNVRCNRFKINPFKSMKKK